MRSGSAALGRRTMLFVDEIHRFNKAQQDAFLPYVERGDIILIGATTENPSFEVISALLSRSRVYALRALTVPEIVTLLERALPLLKPASGSDELLEQIAIYSNGDARQAYNTLEAAAAASHGGRLTEAGGAGRHAAQDAALRQERRGALQPDFGAAQIGAVERCGRGAVLAGAHAGGGRGPDVHRAAAGADGDRGYRPGRSARAGAGHRRQAGGPFSGYSGGRSGAGAGGDLSGGGAEVGRGVSGAERGAAGRGEDDRGAGADAPAQCAHAADEGSGATARATSTRTSSRMPCPIWSACRRRWPGSSIISRPIAVWRSGSASGWRRYGDCGKGSNFGSSTQRRRERPRRRRRTQGRERSWFSSACFHLVAVSAFECCSSIVLL